MSFSMGRHIWRRRKMSNWKEELITGYVELERERVTLEQARAEDQEIKNVELTMKKAEATLSALEQPYSTKLLGITQDIEKIKEVLIEGWDITEKTCEYDIGSATFRITKSLKIQDKKELIQTLMGIGKLPEAIRSWNLSYLRKLKDVDIISDAVATYEEHHNVVIKRVAEK